MLRDCRFAMQVRHGVLFVLLLPLAWPTHDARISRAAVETRKLVETRKTILIDYHVWLEQSEGACYLIFRSLNIQIFRSLNIQNDGTQSTA
jgi:hypothetical protein